MEIQYALIDLELDIPAGIQSSLKSYEDLTNQISSDLSKICWGIIGSG